MQDLLDSGASEPLAVYIDSALLLPPWRQPRGKWMVSLVDSNTNATSKSWHLWEIDPRFALNSTPGWIHKAICLNTRGSHTEIPRWFQAIPTRNAEPETRNPKRSSGHQICRCGWVPGWSSTTLEKYAAGLRRAHVQGS